MYCQYGWTPAKGNGEKIKRAGELLDEIETAFRHHQKAGTVLHCITLAGNGEPTIHPDFLALVRGLVRLRDEIYPGVKIGVLSDSSQAHRPEIREALGLLDERYMKLDTGDEALHAEINKPRGNFNFQRMLDSLKTLDDIVIQSLFMAGSHENTRPGQIEKWIQAVAYVRPREVQVYTVDRGPADPGLEKVSPEKLHEIAAACQAQTGIPSVVFD